VTPPGTSPVGALAELECKLHRLTGSLTADAEVVARTTASPTSSATPPPVSSVRPKSNRPDRENPVSTTDHEEIENVLLQAAQSVILIAVPVVVLDGKNQW
jgi:hypothetical protein